MKKHRFDDNFIVKSISFMASEFELIRTPLSPSLTSYRINVEYNTQMNFRTLRVIQLQGKKQYESTIIVSKENKFCNNSIDIDVDVKKGLIDILCKNQGCRIELRSKCLLKIIKDDTHEDTYVLYIVYS